MDGIVAEFRTFSSTGDAMALSGDAPGMQEGLVAQGHRTGIRSLSGIRPMCVSVDSVTSLQQLCEG